MHNLFFLFQVSETRSNASTDCILPPTLQTGSSGDLTRASGGEAGSTITSLFIGGDVEDPRHKRAS